MYILMMTNLSCGEYLSHALLRNYSYLNSMLGYSVNHTMYNVYSTCIVITPFNPMLETRVNHTVFKVHYNGNVVISSVRYGMGRT